MLVELLAESLAEQLLAELLAEELVAEPVAEELVAQLPAELGEDLVAAELVVEELVPAQPSAELLTQLPAHHCRPTRTGFCQTPCPRSWNTDPRLALTSNRPKRPHAER